jgi:2-oxo-3-hexenedioate decarboxylase
MTPQSLLAHCDSGQLWPSAPSDQPSFEVAQAYRDALAVRALRIARGERPTGFKVGFTNRNIWQRYNVFGPIWGTVYDTTVTFCDGQGTISLSGTCQPRLEPETVFGMKSNPPVNASLDDLFKAIDWVAPGFEIVQSHLPGWKFKAADTVADGGLHARLLVGSKVPVMEIAESATQFSELLASSRVDLIQGEKLVESGSGCNVLDSPLLALHHFLKELRSCPGAPDLMPGDVITTGTWTDAWSVEVGAAWTADFGPPLSPLRVKFT